MGDHGSDSQYSPLRVPEFTSQVPAHLLSQLDEGMGYMLHSLSVVQQQNKWIIQSLIDQNTAIRDLDIRQQASKAAIELRLQSCEAWRDRLTSKWAVIVVIFGFIAPIIVKPVVERILFPPSHQQKSIP